jgi:hypothetical protein
VFQRDYIARAIEQLAAALASIARARAQDDDLAALETIRSAKQGLPVVPGLVDQLPIPDLARVLEAPELLSSLAELARHEAEIRHRRGETPQALQLLMRAKKIETHLGISQPSDDPAEAAD